MSTAPAPPTEEPTPAEGVSPPSKLPWYRHKWVKIATLGLSSRLPDDRRRRRRVLRRLTYAAVALLVVVLIPAIWVRASAAGRLVSPEEAPATDVAIVFGAQLENGGKDPMSFLRNRLDMAARLVTSGKVKVLLISGDGHGGSGNEVRAMSAYLAARGVEQSRLVLDPYGLDTYDTCRRAHDVYGVNRAILVSQDIHLYRAVTLCRHLGIDAWGVPSGCEGCQKLTILYNTVRDVGAAWKAAGDVLSHRPPAVQSPPDPSVQRMVSAHTPQ